MKSSEETASQRVQEFSYPWSGRIEKVGRDLLMPWLDADHTEAGSVWVPLERMPELVEALLVHLPQDSGFVRDLMRQALNGHVPDEDVEDLVERTSGAALLVVEHALSLVAKAHGTGAVKAGKKYGSKNVIPTGKHKGAL